MATEKSKLSGVLITGVDGSGKSFVGNLFCGKPKPFKECEMSANLDAPTYCMVQADGRRIVDAHAAALSNASKTFSSDCPVDTIVFVFRGVFKDDDLALLSKLPNLVPQPLYLIVVQNWTKPNASVAEQIYQKIVAKLATTTWHYVSVKLGQLPYEKDVAFEKAGQVLKSAVIQ